MELFIGSDSLLQLLFAYIAPGTDSIAHNLDVESNHFAQCRPEHALERKRYRASFL